MKKMIHSQKSTGKPWIKRGQPQAAIIEKHGSNLLSATFFFENGSDSDRHWISERW